ncbi:MAG: histidine phosphatase family protein [Mycolicibacterium sp.]|uniref:histidine phosphatase family protein n=1 Tax=Mycolicibacterium sp. TaxID=2320850 RepID=UPI000FAD6E45|nr:histidine phosphatase family protein [Mycolicibacterium sp.]RUP28309.1 MAG: histidine phosphatase family protein [Mycolicibacterium sp.]
MINHTNSEDATGKRRRARGLKGLGVALTASALLVMSALPAWAAENMTITFIRHGQSYGNTSGNIDTQVPGPVLTPDGQQQAKDIAAQLGDRNFDAIYASTMVRTQQTATPLSQYLGLPITVLPGLQEIEAGKYEGTPERAGLFGYLTAPLAWAGLSVTPPPNISFNPIAPNLDAFIPSAADPTTGLNGHQFEDRVNGALQTIYDNGDRNAAVFSHGGTIMIWTMMNAKNLSAEQKIMLFTQHPLGNTGVVVVEGNPEDGWNLVEWNGVKIAGMQKGPIENVMTQVRTLTRQLNSVVQDVAAAFQTGNVGKILTAINHGAADALFSTAKFVRAINAQVIGGVTTAIDNLQKKLAPPAPAAGTQTTAPTSGAAVSPAAFSAPVAAKAPAAAQAGDSPAKVADAPASDNKVDGQAKADEAKADADAAKAEGQTKADDAKAGADAAKAEGQAKADDAKAKADAKKAAAEAKKAAAKAKAEEKKAAAEAKKAEAKAKADAKKAAAEAKKAEAKAKAESAKATAGAGAGSSD